MRAFPLALVVLSLALVACASTQSGSDFGPDSKMWWDEYMDEDNPPNVEQMPEPAQGIESIEEMVHRRMGGQRCLGNPRQYSV